MVGGAVVSIYTEGAYKSGDLDFVLNEFSRKELNRVLSTLGFKQEARFYKHQDCPHLFLEFASFPASIGNDYNLIPDEIREDGTIIKIFSPTDCVRDRLASYAYFHARDCLDQAVMVAAKHSVNLVKIKHWCIDENIIEKYNDFIEELKSKSSRYHEKRRRK